MTRQNEAMEQARKELATQLARANGVNFSNIPQYRKQVYLDMADEFLGRPEIRIQDRDQSLPKVDVHLTCEHCNDYELGMNKLRDEENWVKVLPKKGEHNAAHD